MITATTRQCLEIMLKYNLLKNKYTIANNVHKDVKKTHYEFKRLEKDVIFYKVSGLIYVCGYFNDGDFPVTDIKETDGRLQIRKKKKIKGLLKVLSTLLSQKYRELNGGENNTIGIGYTWAYLHKKRLWENKLSLTDDVDEQAKIKEKICSYKINKSRSNNFPHIPEYTKIVHDFMKENLKNLKDPIDLIEKENEQRNQKNDMKKKKIEKWFDEEDRIFRNIANRKNVVIKPETLENYHKKISTYREKCLKNCSNTKLKDVRLFYKKIKQKINKKK